MLWACLLTVSLLGAEPVTVSSATCSVTFDGLRIVEVKDLLRDETLTTPLGLIQLLDAQSKPVTFDTVNAQQNGIETIIRGASSSGDELRAFVTVDGNDICLWFEADRAQAGLRSVSFGLDDIEGRHSFIAPLLGGMKLAANTPVGAVRQMYPGGWQSQFALVEGAKGGLFIRSTDASLSCKWISFRRNGWQWSLRFESEVQAPFTQQKSIRTPEWRISAYRGDWRTPTRQYRAWMENAFKLKSFVPGSWEDGIRCVITTNSKGLTDKALDLLAQRLIPEQTLLYLPDWRVHPYDVMYPDYDPAEGVQQETALAESKGFHVMLHTDLPGVSAGHAFFPLVKQHQVRDAVTLEPQGWWLETNLPQSFPFINPASSVFRAEFVARMEDLSDTVVASALHLDVSAATFNDGNGLVDGLTYAQGVARLHEELAATLPEMVFGGESLTESTLSHERFWQLWPGLLVGNTHQHPIVTELYWPYCRPYGYLGMPDPTRDENLYHRYLSDYDNNALLVTIPLYDIEGALSTENAGLDALFRLAKAHQLARTQPVLDLGSEDKTLVWKGDKVLVLTSRDKGLTMTSVNGSPIIGHGVGLRRVSGLYPTDTYWPAWNEGGVFGLKPERGYLFQPTPPRSTGLHITKITGPASMIERVVDYPDAAVIDLASYPPEPTGRLIDYFQDAKTFCRRGEETRPIEDGAVCQFEMHQAGGVSREALYFLPAWLKAEGDWITGISCTVPVPPNAELRFSHAIDDQAMDTDGATLIVSIDGKKMWENHITEKRWTAVSIPIGNTEAKSATIEIIEHPGPANNRSWDMALISNLAIYGKTGVASKETVIELTPDPAQYPLMIGGELRGMNLVSVGALESKPLVFFKQLKPEQALPIRLLDELPQPFLEFGGVARPGSVFGSGKSVKNSSGGAAREGLFAHPPAGGKTLFHWVCALPAPAGTLRFAAGITDGAQTDGVTFSVLVNGQNVWEWFTQEPGWKEDAVNLVSHQGQITLIELVADSGATAQCDWANWANIRIE